MNLDKYLATIIGFILTTVAGFITWLVRTVLTNQKQIALLQEEISSRDVRREEDRTVWKELKDDVKEIKRDILDIYKNHKEQ